MSADCPTIALEDNSDIILSNYNVTFGSSVVIGCRGFGRHIQGPTEVVCKDNGQWSETPNLECARALDTRETVLVAVFAGSGALLLVCLIILCCACACGNKYYYRRKGRRVYGTKIRHPTERYPSYPPPYEEEYPDRIIVERKSGLRSSRNVQNEQPYLGRSSRNVQDEQPRVGPLGVAERSSGLWGTRTVPEFREYDVTDGRADVSPYASRRDYVIRREDTNYDRNYDERYGNMYNTYLQTSRPDFEEEFDRVDDLRRSRRDNNNKEIRSSRRDFIDKRSKSLREILRDKDDEYRFRDDIKRERIHRYVEDSKSNLEKSRKDEKYGYKKGFLTGHDPIKFNREHLSLDHVLYKGRGKVKEIYEDRTFENSYPALIMTNGGHLGITTRTDWMGYIPRPTVHPSGVYENITYSSPIYEDWASTTTR